MKLPGRKSKLQRVLDAVGDPLDGADAVRRGLSSVAGRTDLRPDLPDAARRAGQVAGGVAGLTALSAGISTYRRRAAETRDRS